MNVHNGDVEQLLDPEALRRFDRRRELVFKTSQKLRLRAGGAIIVGGAGLALHNLDSRVGHSPLLHPFDVDAFVSRDKLNELKDRYPKTNWLSGATFVHVVRPIVPLSFTGFRTGISTNQEENYYPDYESALDDIVHVDGLPTLPADKLAGMKVRAGRIKDLGGLVKAHIVGGALGNPITKDPYWQGEVSTAIDCLREKETTMSAWCSDAVPEWLAHLAEIGYEHPTLQDVT